MQLALVNINVVTQAKFDEAGTCTSKMKITLSDGTRHNGSTCGAIAEILMKFSP